MKRLVFLPGAEADLTAMVEFWDRKRPGMGRELVAAVERALATIEGAPSAQPVFGPARQGNTEPPPRKYMLARFPCTIVFRERASDVCVVALVHGRRGPELRSGVVAVTP